MMEITDALRACVLEPVLSRLVAGGELKNIAQRIKNRETDPYTEAEAIAHRFLKSGDSYDTGQAKKALRQLNRQIPKKQQLSPTLANRGLVIVITGNGKGKTTSAFGQALRAVGQGYKVFIMQFMKGRNYGEFVAAEKYLPRLTIRRSGLDSFVMRDKPAPVDIELARQGFELAKKAIASGKYNMVILDEINVAIDFNLIPLEEMIRLIKNKPSSAGSDSHRPICS